MHRHTRAAILILAILMAASCAPMRSAPPKPRAPIAPRSNEAEAIYNYLKFEDAKLSGRIMDAKEALRNLLRLDPKPSLYQQGTDYLWRTGHIGEARAMLKEGIALYPQSRELAVALANTYYSEKRHDDAVMTLRDYLARVPDDWTAHKDMALIHLDAGDHAQAMEDLKNIPTEHRDAPILYYWAKASAGLGLNRQAREKLHEAVKKDPFFVEAWAELAYLYEVDGNFLEAEKVYSRLLDLGEMGSEVYLRLISLNLKLNNPDRALALYRQGPKDAPFALEAASLLLDEKFYDQARAVLIPLSERDDAPPRIWFYLAVLAFEGDRDAARAVSYLQRIPDTDLHFHRAARFRINLLMEMGEKERALTLIREMKLAYPDKSDYSLLEASYLQRQGDFALALVVLSEAVAKWPNDTELLYAQGIVLDKLGRREEGLAIMEQIISIDADNADALNYVGYLLAEENRDLERAMVLITRALEIEPDNGYIIDSLAWLHFQKGELDKAWELIQRAVERLADESEVWTHYGDIAAGLGLKTKAREGYRNSLELTPENDDVTRKLKAL